MIKSLKLVNFQSHKESQLDFKPGVNVILGPSNSGKTALMRAIYLVAENSGGGLSDISHWNMDEKGNPIKDMSVMIETEEDSISRIRGKSFNGYSLNADKFGAVGLKVPEEITKALNILPINLQKQMDGPFLFSKGAAEVGRYLNEIVNLEIIGKVLAEAEKRRRQLNQVIKTFEDNLEETENKLKAFENLEVIEAFIAKANKIDSSISTQKGNLSKLMASLSNMQKAHAIIEEQEKLLTLEDLVETYDTIDQRVNKKYEILRRLKGQVASFKDSSNLLTKLQAISPLSKKVEEYTEKDKGRLKALQSLNKLKSSIQELTRNSAIRTSSILMEELRPQVEKLDDLLHDHLRILNNISKFKTSQLDLENLETLLISYNKMLPESCPLCGNPYHGDH